MIERRLSLRLLAYWERARAGRVMPELDDMLPEALQDVWADCFILEIKNPETVDFSIAHRGENLHGEWPHMAHLTSSVKIVLSRKGPVLEEAEIFDDSGAVLKYRQCLLPLGDGQEVAAVFGGARFRLFES